MISHVAKADFLIVGAGIIGLAVALELRRRHGAARIVVLEKESTIGRHASGRNSGVLHAGFYYSPDSLKARLTRIGNERLTAYCVERGLPILRCGKLVVAQNADDLPRLDELFRRGQANGVTLSMISAAEAKEIEPRAITFERAIWSPTTSTVDPIAILEALLADARGAGIEVRFDTPFWSAATAVAAFDAGFVVNAAGLHADTIARRFGFAHNHRILPFKGLYLHISDAFRTHVYPVPDPRFPFLGVHVTAGVDGHAKIGPTAIPALWREQYGGLRGFRAGELLEIAVRGLRLAMKERIAPAFFPSQRTMVREAEKIATRIHADHWGKPGIRAQLVDTRTNRLEMDFVVEGDARSLHVLNAVSPGFTCALPFAEFIADRIEGSA